MRTYGDIGAGLLHEREALRPRMVAGWAFAALPPDERRTALKLWARLDNQLGHLGAVVDAADADAPVEKRWEILLGKLGRLRTSLQRTELAPAWTGQIRDVIHTTRVVLEPPAKPAISKSAGGIVPRESGRHAPNRRSGAAPNRTPRYANALLLDRASGRRLSREQAIPAGQPIRLRLDIGVLARESQVEDSDPFPDHALPDEDVWIDVMVSSTHFGVAEAEARPVRARAVHGRFMLPRDGSHARAPDGGKFLYFELAPPSTPRRGARARVSYYFRGAVVQSQVLVADVGTDPGGFRILNDFTVSANPTHLGAIRQRPRISVFFNSDIDGDHQASVRAQGREGPAVGKPFVVKQGVGKLVGAIRTVLRSEGVAPTTRRRSRDRLIADLRALAPLGWKLASLVPAQFMDGWSEIDKNSEDLVLQIVRSSTSAFTFPWTFIYDHVVESHVRPEKLEVCRLLQRWDGKSPLFEGSPRRCPEEASHPANGRNFICPFGFWGFRYSLEQISSSDKPVTEIMMPASPEVVVAETQFEVDKKRLQAHVTELGTVLRGVFPAMALHEGKTRAAIEALLGNDLPLVYFFCHGERENAGDPNTYLGVGNREQIAAADFIGWVKGWRSSGKSVWNSVRPLVFINACHSLEINPDTLVSYLDAFVGTAGAAGVIGTEVKVHQELAMEFAVSFFRYFTQNDWTADRALRQARLDFMRDGNLFGLLYTPYCWADLALRPAPA